MEEFKAVVKPQEGQLSSGLEGSGQTPAAVGFLQQDPAFKGTICAGEGEDPDHEEEELLDEE